MGNESAKLKLIMEIDGERVVVNGLQQVDAAVDRTAQTTNKMGAATGRMAQEMEGASGRMAAATGRMTSGMGNVSVVIGDITMASGRMAASHENNMSRMAEASKRAQGGMSGFEKGLWDIQMRIMNITMALALLTAAIVMPFKAGIDIVDDFQVATISIAAQLTQMQGPKDVAKHYQQSLAYAGALAEKLQEVDANSLANNKGLTAMLQTMTMQGVVLDINNKKQVDGFTSLSNAIAMFTKGQDQQLQMYQETRAIMSGVPDQHAQVSKALDQAIKAQGIYKGGLKEVVALGKQHGDTLERLQPYLVGINMATGDINKTWSAATSSMQTSISAVVRAGFGDIVKDMVGWLQIANGYLKEHAGEIGGRIREGWEATKKLIEITAVVLQGVGAVLQTTISPAVQSIFFILRDTVTVIEAIPSLLSSAPGVLTAIGVAAFSAVGGIAGLTAAYTSLTTAIAASVAANPVAWAVGIGVAFGYATQPWIKALDEIIYKYTQVNLTGEAMYNAEMKRAADADKAWEQQKQKALFMYKEGGIPLSPTMKSALGPQVPEIPPPGPSADDLKKAEEMRKVLADFKTEVANSTPFISKYDQEINKINNHYDDAIAKTPSLREELELLRKKHIDNITIQQQYKESLELGSRAQEDAAEADRRRAAGLEAMGKHYQTVWKTMDVEKESSMLNVESSGGDTEKAKLRQSYEDRIEMARRANVEIAMLGAKASQEQLDQEAANSKLIIDLAHAKIVALGQLDAERAENFRKSLDDMVSATADIRISTIQDPYEQQLAGIKKHYADQRKELSDHLKAQLGMNGQSEKDRFKLLSESIKKLRAYEEAETSETEQAKWGMWQQSLGFYGGVLSQMGDMIDQSSRDGFEANKAFAIGATIMNTASSIMAQTAGPDGWTPAAWGRAVAVGLIGAMQVAKIASTSYGSGGSVGGVSAGSFSGGSAGAGGSVGGSIGAPTTSTRDGLSYEQLQSIANSMENASMAIGKVADGLTKISDLFADGSFLSMIGGALTSNALPEEKGFLSKAWMNGRPNVVMDGLDSFWRAQGALSTFDFSRAADQLQNMTDIAGQISTLGLFGSVFGGGRSIEGSGIALGLNQGSVTAKN
ncbi:hypothetical protein KI809_15770, partial [Geobacter pelophilus]